jgi:CheY-like chemotaxis protein
MSALQARALILDDSPVLARHLQQLLQGLGVSALLHTQGVARLPEAEVDVIFVEVLQASGNGFQVLRELARARACPLVLLTGTGRASDRHWGLQAGAAAVLRRPVDTPALQCCLQELGLLSGNTACGTARLLQEQER